MLKRIFNKRTAALAVAFTLIAAIQPPLAMGAEVPSASVSDAFFIGQKSATVSVDIACDNAFYAPQATYVYYSATNIAPGPGDAGKKLDTGGNVTLSGLNAGTKYNYAVVFTYKNKSTGVQGNFKTATKSFTTAAAIQAPGTAPSVSVGNATAVTHSSAGVNVTVPANYDDTLYTPVSIDLYYSATNKSPGQGDTSINKKSDGSFTLPKLAAKKQYYYAAVLTYKINATGAEATSKSAVQNFTTLQAPVQTAMAVPSVTVSAASNRTQNSATVTVSINASDSEIQSCILYYSTLSADLENSGMSKSCATGGPVTLDGLTSDTAYYYMAVLSYKTDNDDEKAYSDVNSFTTLSPPPPSLTISAPVITYTNATTANVTFNYTTSNCTVTEYGVKVNGQVNQFTVGAQSAGSFNKTITGLSLNNEYAVIAYVKYTDGSENTQIKDSTMIPYKHVAPAAVKPTVTTDSATYSATTGKISLAGTVTNAGSANVTDRGFVYSYTNSSPTITGTGNTKYQVSGTVSAGTKNSSYSGTITADTSKTQCYVRAYATSSVDTVYGIARTVTLPGTSSSAVTMSSVTDVSTYAATANIYVESVGKGISTSGVVYATSNSSSYLTRGSSYSAGYVEAKNTATGSKSYDLSGLKANTTYYVKAYVKNNDGTYTYSSDSTIKSFKTSSTNANTNTSKPTVTTSSVDSDQITAYTAEVDINVTSAGSSTVTERGVVYSSTSSDLNDENNIKLSNCYKQLVGGTTGKTTVLLSNLRQNTTYYVRAYARNSSGYSYGALRTFTTKSSGSERIPEVTTDYVTVASSTSMDVKINVTSAGNSSVTDRGVVYSKDSANPSLNTYSTSYQRISGTTGTGTATISNLSTNTTYYVRAYATNSYGTAYGEVKEVSTGRYSVTTSRVTNISNNSATAGGVISSGTGSISDRGVVYSSTNSVPTASDNLVSANSSSSSYSVSLTRLSANTRYYVRAYMKISNSYYYGDIVNFTTSSSENTSFTVIYKTSEGTQVGSQTLSANGSTIWTDSLDIPYGYELLSPAHSFQASSGETITVYVKKPSSSTAYMEATPDNRFEPDRNITRLEVAKMIYALRGKGNAGQGKSFTDIPAGFADQDAIDYVSATNLMTGFPDGSFKPYDNITRAEVAVVCNTVYKLTGENLSNPFSDTDAHWGRDFITIAYQNGVIHGFPDGTYKPDKNMTRAEAVTLFALADKRDTKPLGSGQFTDVPRSHWAYDFIMNAAVAW